MTKEEAIRRYRHHQYSCAGYMCTVATTCYEPEEQEGICVRCIMERDKDDGAEDKAIEGE